MEFLKREARRSRKNKKLRAFPEDKPNSKGKGFFNCLLLFCLIILCFHSAAFKQDRLGFSFRKACCTHLFILQFLREPFNQLSTFLRSKEDAKVTLYECSLKLIQLFLQSHI